MISEFGPAEGGAASPSSTERVGSSHDRPVTAEPPTDPMMPAITGEQHDPEAVVISSPYGEYRPPVSLTEEPSLTGLSPLSRSRMGSLLFTLVFAAIFVLILVQALVSLFTTGSGH
jgi:hypothetical protein